MDFSEALFFRDQLREARASAGRDSEGYQEVLFALERIGIRLRGKMSTLGGYRAHLCDLAAQSASARSLPTRWPEFHMPFDDLYDEVLRARNDALHYGAFVRLLTVHAVQLTMILEDALMADAKQVSHFMVRSPASALLWQPISFVRQVMLANAFSYLPVFDPSISPGKWRLVSEGEVAKFLRSAQTNEERNKRLATALKDAVQGEGLKLHETKTVPPDTPLQLVLDALSKYPVLVIKGENPEELLGIVTASDVL